MTLTIQEKDYPDLPDLHLDNTGEVTLIFKVVGVNKYDDESIEGEVRSCTLDVQVKSMSVKKVSLEDAASKASEIYVKTQTTPAP